MENIKKLAIYAVSNVLGVDITEDEFDYLSVYWAAWLRNMDKYSNCNEMIKSEILEMRE